MTEPEAGSAVTDLKTTATADGKGYRVTGEKIFTTHAPYADVMVVYVRYGPGVERHRLRADTRSRPRA